MNLTFLQCIWTGGVPAFLRLIESPQQNLSFSLVLEIFLIEIFRQLALILFACLTWLACNSISRILTNDIEHHNSTMVSVQQIKIWRKNYLIVLEFIAEINEFFGPILLFSVMGIFVETTMFTFRFSKLMFIGSESFLGSGILKIIRGFITMFALLIVPEKMKEKVRWIHYLTNIYDITFTATIWFNLNMIGGAGFDFDQRTGKTWFQWWNHWIESNFFVFLNFFFLFGRNCIGDFFFHCLNIRHICTGESVDFYNQSKHASNISDGNVWSWVRINPDGIGSYDYTYLMTCN